MPGLLRSGPGPRVGRKAEKSAAVHRWQCATGSPLQIAWGVLGVAGIYWYPLHCYSAPTILFGAGIGCIANWLKHRSFHCAVTAPLFLIAAILFLVDSLGIARVNVSLVWSLLFVGTGVAFLLEWKYAKRSGSRGS